MDDSTAPGQLLSALLDADAQALRAHEKLRDYPDQEAVCAATVARLRSLLAADLTSAEDELAIQRLLEICSEIASEASTQAILEALGHADAVIRDAASDAALQRTYERYAEVARMVERRALPPLALQELCFVFAQVGEPSTVRLLSGLLAHDDPEVVAAAIEALTEYGDPAATKSLSPLVGDEREVTLEHADEEFVATIGELASEALEELGKS